MQRLKLDPIAYLLIAAVLAIQVYATFLRDRDVDDIIATSNEPTKPQCSRIPARRA